MIIETISFEIFTSTKGNEEFLVENTDLNYEMILRNRFTRQIKFGKTFDFQFARERKAPRFIEFAEIVENVVSQMQADEIDDVDEMVGSF